MTLSEDQMKVAIAAFGKDEVDNLINEAEKRTAELEAAGTAHKDKSEVPETEQPEPQKINMEELAAEVGKQFGANLEPIAEAIATMTGGMKELNERLEKLEKEQGVKNVTEKPRFVFEWQRASEAEETMVTEDDGLKDKKPAETKGTTSNSDPWQQIFG